MITFNKVKKEILSLYWRYIKIWNSEFLKLYVNRYSSENCKSFMFDKSPIHGVEFFKRNIRLNSCGDVVAEFPISFLNKNYDLKKYIVNKLKRDKIKFDLLAKHREYKRNLRKNPPKEIEKSKPSPIFERLVSDKIITVDQAEKIKLVIRSGDYR